MTWNSIFSYFIVFGILLIAYRFLLQSSKRFTLKRLILISIPLISFLGTQFQFGSYSALTSPTFLPEVQIQFHQTISQLESTYINYSELIYWAGVLLFACWFVYRFYISLNVDSKQPGYSFLNKVHVSSDLNEESAQAIEAHELTHSTRFHSLDILLLELVRIVFWFNPMHTYLMKMVRLNHEFEADAEASKNSHNYSKILLAQHLKTDYHLLGHAFNKSNLKQRLIMIESKKTKQRLSHYLLFAAISLTSVSVSAWSPGFEPSSNEHTASTGDKEVKPEFKGGMDALIDYMSSTIVYPESAKKEGIEGKVLVAFVVNKEGKVMNANVKKGVNQEIDQVALNAVKGMPNWTPGTKNGKAASFEMVLPVVFKLPE